MWHFIITALLFFGGVFMYFLDLLTFKSKLSNIHLILGFVLAMIPGIGFISYMIFFLYNAFNYQKDSFYHIMKDNSIVRDTKINRILFNDVNWPEYDRCINKIYEQDKNTQETK